MINVTGIKGDAFSLDATERGAWGDLQLKFKFELNWAAGTVQATCSADRVNQFKAFLESLTPGTECNYDFINEDGNLEIKVTSLFSGLCLFEVIASPNMTDDDGIEFSFEGRFELSTAGGAA